MKWEAACRRITQACDVVNKDNYEYLKKRIYYYADKRNTTAIIDLKVWRNAIKMNWVEKYIDIQRKNKQITQNNGMFFYAEKTEMNWHEKIIIVLSIHLR